MLQKNRELIKDLIRLAFWVVVCYGIYRETDAVILSIAVFILAVW